MARTIEFPEINWDDLKKGALSKDKVWDEIEKAVKFLLEVRMLKTTSFLSRDTIDNARETAKRLNEMKENYPQVIGVIQNLLGRKIKEWAEKDADSADSRTLFNRLGSLTLEAKFHGSLKEWTVEELEGRTGDPKRKPPPIGLRKSFEVRLYNPRTKETRYFLPRNWRNEVHRRTALTLHDLSFKARDTYRAERGIETPTRKETPAETPSKTMDTKSLVAKAPEKKPVESKPKKKPAPKPKPKKKTVPKKTSVKKKTTSKPKKKDEADAKAAKRAKKVRVKDEEKEDEKEIRAHLKAEAVEETPGKARLAGKPPLDIVPKKSKK